AAAPRAAAAAAPRAAAAARVALRLATRRDAVHDRLSRARAARLLGLRRARLRVGARGADAIEIVLAAAVVAIEVARALALNAIRAGRIRRPRGAPVRCGAVCVRVAAAAAPPVAIARARDDRRDSQRA